VKYHRIISISPIFRLLPGTVQQQSISDLSANYFGANPISKTTARKYTRILGFGIGQSDTTGSE